MLYFIGQLRIEMHIICSSSRRLLTKRLRSWHLFRSRGRHLILKGRRRHLIGLPTIIIEMSGHLLVMLGWVVFLLWLIGRLLELWHLSFCLWHGQLGYTLVLSDYYGWIIPPNYDIEECSNQNDHSKDSRDWFIREHHHG